MIVQVPLMMNKATYRAIENQLKMSFILDSGGTFHICNGKMLFTNLKKNTRKFFFVGFNKNYVRKYGSVFILI